MSKTHKTHLYLETLELREILGEKREKRETEMFLSVKKMGQSPSTSPETALIIITTKINMQMCPTQTCWPACHGSI